MLAFDVVRRPYGDSDMLRRLINCRIIISIIIGGLRARPNEIKARSSIDQPERTVHYDCAICIAEMLHNTIDT